MDAREVTGRQVGGNDAITTRIGAVALPLGIIVILFSEYFHPSREDPMDNPAVFMEYARSDIWTAVHLAEYFGFLLLLGGLVALYYSISAKPGVGAGLAPFGLAAAVTTAASFTILQAVDGIALKRAVDAWAIAPADQETAAFAAAEAVRWTEIGVEQPLVLPFGTDPLSVRSGYRAWHRLPALGGMDGIGFRSRAHVSRRGGGELRRLWPVDLQPGGPGSLGGVGVHHGRLDVAQR
jgi:hypothetical protein